MQDQRRRRSGHWSCWRSPSAHTCRCAYIFHVICRNTDLPVVSHRLSLSSLFKLSFSFSLCISLLQLLSKIAGELQGQPYYLYIRAFSPGLQEYVEAVLFQKCVSFIQMHSDVCMYVCMYGWMDGWMDVCMYVCIVVCMYVYIYIFSGPYICNSMRQLNLRCSFFAPDEHSLFPLVNIYPLFVAIFFFPLPPFILLSTLSWVYR